MNNTFTESLWQSLTRAYEGAMLLLPALLAALVIILAGLAIAWILGLAVRRMLAATNFNSFCWNTGITQMLTRADITAPPVEIAGRVVFWLGLVVFLLAGVSALGVEVFNQLVAAIFLYLPRLFAAAVILLLGFLVGNFLSRAALLAAVNAHFGAPRLVAGIVKYLIATLAFAMALDQLQIARGIVITAFAIAFGAVMLGLALAFGLGGRAVARDFLGRRFNPKKEQEFDRLSHI